MDTTLGVLAHSALAFGLVAISFVPGVAHRPVGLALRRHPRGVPCRSRASSGAGRRWWSALLAWRWQALLTATLNEDLAHASGLNPDRERLILTLALALVVAVALKVVGALLIAAMLIIPAAAARGLTRSPEAMALVATLIGAAACLGGLQLSLTWDTPAGPSIVAAAAIALRRLGPVRQSPPGVSLSGFHLLFTNIPRGCGGVKPPLPPPPPARHFNGGSHQAKSKPSTTAAPCQRIGSAPHITRPWPPSGKIERWRPGS